MAIVSLLFLLMAAVCGVLAFPEGANGGTIVHIGFIIGMVGFVSFAVGSLARWATGTLDDVPGKRPRKPR
jgi:hypothetical protein